MRTEPININNKDVQYWTLEAHQRKYSKDNDTHKEPFCFSAGSTVAVQWEDRGPWMHGRGGDHI